MHALEHGAWTNKSPSRQQRCADARLRRPSGMQPFGPGAFGKIFDDTAGHAAGYAQRVDDLLAVETERCTDARGRPHRAEDRRWMKARFVNRLRHDETQPAQHFCADRDPDQRHSAIRIVPLAGREHRRHDHGAGMHRAALERVVEILAMRSRAVDKGSAGRVQRAAMPDRRAGTVIVAACQGACNVVLVARGDTQADHVDQQVLAFAQRGRRQGAGLQCGDLVGKGFGDRGLRQSGGHRDQTRKILV